MVTLPIAVVAYYSVVFMNFTFSFVTYKGCVLCFFSICPECCSASHVYVFDNCFIKRLVYINLGNRIVLSHKIVICDEKIVLLKCWFDWRVLRGSLTLGLIHIR